MNNSFPENDAKLKMVVQLMAKDRNEKFQFEGKCKLTINTVSKFVLVEPEIEEFKLISALFKWRFLAQKNILFIFAELYFQDFALIFENETKCKNTFDLLLQKGAIPGTSEMINERFLSPLVDRIAENNDSKLIEILSNWIEQHEGKEKEELIQILKEKNIFELIYPESEQNNGRHLRKRKAKDYISRENGTISNLLTKNNNSKRPRLEDLKPQVKSAPLKNFVESPNFQEIKYVQKGVSRAKLTIFPSSDKKLCYEYSWRKDFNCFVCGSCLMKKRYLKAKIIKKNGKNVVQLKGTQHVCELKKPNKITEKSNYEVISDEIETIKTAMKRLIIFSDSSRTSCYEYTWDKYDELYYCKCRERKLRNPANIYQKPDGTEFVLSKSKHHICEIRPFHPEKFGEKAIIEADNFKIFKNVHNEIDKSKLIIFTSSDKTSCYVYYWCSRTKSFYCCRCSKKKKRVGAKVYQHSDGREYLKLSKLKHVCEPREYDPNTIEMSEEVVESSNFKVFKYKHNGSIISKLIVFCPTNKNLCYEYFWNNTTHCYVCGKCSFEKQITANVSKNDVGKDYLILCKSEHVCDLQEFDHEKYKDDIIINKSMYDNILTSVQGPSNRKALIIFTTKEKKYYYRFYYNKSGKHFYCSKCHALKMNLTATIQNEGKENEHVSMSHRKHICEPLEYSSITNGYIIEAPNFQLIKRKRRGKFIQKLIVFTNNEKSLCYEYTFNEQYNKFNCPTCSYRHKIHVYAKINKNEDDQECAELCPTIHKCQPMKFVPEDLAPKIVTLPNFQLIKRKYNDKIIQHLAVFTNDEKSECFDYTWNEYKKSFICLQCRAEHKISVYAKLLKNDENVDFVELCKNKHKCTPIKFIPENTAPKIVKSPGFKLWEETWRKKKVRRLTIFDSKNYGYIYTYAEIYKKYICNQCTAKHKSVTAKILQDENGENFVQLNNDHVCKLRKL